MFHNIKTHMPLWKVRFSAHIGQTCTLTVYISRITPYGLIAMWLKKYSMSVIATSYETTCQWLFPASEVLDTSLASHSPRALRICILSGWLRRNASHFGVQIGVLGQSGGGWWHSNSSPAEAQWREHPLPTLSAARALRKMDWLATPPKEAMHAVKRLYSTWLLSYASLMKDFFTTYVQGPLFSVWFSLATAHKCHQN